MMNYEQWINTVPAGITDDSLWKMQGYRLSLFMADIAWYDVTKLAAEPRTLKLSDQLYRAVGSIGANIAEGYSRGSGKDRALFYQYALGSARESRDWYYKGRHVLGESVFSHRMQLLTGAIRLLLTMIPQQRGHGIAEARIEYRMQPDYPSEEPYLSPEVDIPDLTKALAEIPLP